MTKRVQGQPSAGTELTLTDSNRVLTLRICVGSTLEGTLDADNGASFLVVSVAPIRRCSISTFDPESDYPDEKHPWLSIGNAVFPITEFEAARINNTLFLRQEGEDEDSMFCDHGFSFDEMCQDCEYDLAKEAIDE